MNDEARRADYVSTTGVVEVGGDANEKTFSTKVLLRIGSKQRKTL